MCSGVDKGAPCPSPWGLPWAQPDSLQVPGPPAPTPFMLPSLWPCPNRRPHRKLSKRLTPWGLKEVVQPLSACPLPTSRGSASACGPLVGLCAGPGVAAGDSAGGMRGMCPPSYQPLTRPTDAREPCS